jgi:hypothetical protein
MKLGGYTAKVGAQEQWKQMQRGGLLLHILSTSSIWVAVGVLPRLFDAWINRTPLPAGLILGYAVIGGFVGLLTAGFSWRSAKKKAERARELEA